MYVTVQKVYGKSKIQGYSKDVVTTRLQLGTTIRYGWTYSKEKFERENYSYKITVKESYRENGKVKQKQVVMGTFHWFDFIDHYVYNDEYFYRKLVDIFPDKRGQIDNIYDKIDKKIQEIQSIESKKWTSSQEYKVHNKHLEMISNYESKKKECDELWGEGYFEQIFDIHMKIMNQQLYEQIPQIRAKKIKEDKEKREYERRSYEEFQKTWDNFYKQYTSSSYSIGLSSNYSDKEKEYLKKFYRTLAIKYHPDVIGDNEPMQFLNKLKQSWGI